MAQLTRAQLKALWVTGYVPTQTDFSNFFDSFFNLLDNTAPLLAVVNMTSAQILNSFTSPIVIIPAVGAGKFVQVLSIEMNYTFVTTAYTTSGNLAFGTGPPFTGNSQSYASHPVLTRTASGIGHLTVASLGTGATIQILTNTDFVAASPIANPTLGDGTLKVYVAYQVITA